MNEELQKQIAAILKQALDAARHGGQWLAGQIPDVLHQLIVWTIVIGAVSAVAGVVIAVFTVMGWVRLMRWVLADKEYGDRELACFPAAFVSAFTVLATIWCISNALDGLKAFVAPKLFLLEYAAHLVK